MGQPQVWDMPHIEFQCHTLDFKPAIQTSHKDVSHLGGRSMCGWLAILWYQKLACLVLCCIYVAELHVVFTTALRHEKAK